MSVYQKELFYYAAVERANKVERLQLERKCKLYEKEYRHAHRQAVSRREEARHEIRRLQQNKMSAITLWPAASMSSHGGTLPAGADRVSIHSTIDSQGATSLPASSSRQLLMKETSSALTQNTTSSICEPSPSGSLGMPSVGDTSCEKGSSGGSESDRSSCGSSQGSTKNIASTGTGTTQRPGIHTSSTVQPGTGNTSRSLKQITTLCNSVPSGSRNSRTPSVSASVKGSESYQDSCGNPQDSSKNSASTGTGTPRRPRVHSSGMVRSGNSKPSPSRSSGIPILSASIKGLCDSSEADQGSNSSDSDQGSCGLPASSKTSTSANISSSSNRHSTGPSGAIITALSRSVDSSYNSEMGSIRVSETQSSTMTRYDQTRGGYKLSTRYDDTHRHIRRHYGDLVTDILNRPYVTAPALKINKRHKDKQADLTIMEAEKEAEATSADSDAKQTRSTHLPNLVDSNRKGSRFRGIVKSALPHKTSCAGTFDSKNPRRVQFVDEAAATPKMGMSKSLLDRHCRSLPTDALLAPAHSLNIQNNFQARHRSLDISGIVTGTHDVIHRQQMSWQTLSDTALSRESSKGAESSTGMGGWKKLKTFVSTGAHLKNKGGAPSNVEARLTLKRNPSYQLLLMIKEENKKRAPSELLNMDRERKMLADRVGN